MFDGYPLIQHIHIFILELHRSLLNVFLLSTRALVFLFYSYLYSKLLKSFLSVLSRTALCLFNRHKLGGDCMKTVIAIRVIPPNIKQLVS